MTMFAQRPTAQNDITGTLADFVSVGACFESRARTSAVITLFVAFLSLSEILRVVTSMKS